MSSQGKLSTSKVVYQATVKRQDNFQEETYIGLTENSFKTRYRGHTCSCNNANHRNDTTLSQYVWNLNDKHITYSLKWKIVAHGKSYSPSYKKCNLCLTEKYFIIYKPNMATLNNKKELISSCRHRRNHLLCSVK